MKRAAAAADAALLMLMPPPPIVPLPRPKHKEKRRLESPVPHVTAPSPLLFSLSFAGTWIWRGWSLACWRSCTPLTSAWSTAASRCAHRVAARATCLCRSGGAAPVCRRVCRVAPRRCAGCAGVGGLRLAAATLPSERTAGLRPQALSYAQPLPAWHAAAAPLLPRHPSAAGCAVGPPPGPWLPFS